MAILLFPRRILKNPIFSCPLFFRRVIPNALGTTHEKMKNTIFEKI